MDPDKIEEIENQEEEKAEKPRRKRNSEPKNIENTKICFKDGLTVYEGKMSVLIFGTLITLIFALTMYFLRLDISNNLTSIVETFIMCIAGVTTAEQTINTIKEKGIFGFGKSNEIKK